MRKLQLISVISVSLIAPSSLLFAASNDFAQVNLVSDLSGWAPTTDPNLKNPWGMSFGATSPFWVSNQGSTMSTLYTGSGGIVPLVVSVPPSTGVPTGPTGQVFAAGMGFSGSPIFIFDTLAGTIDTWGKSSGTTASIAVTSPGSIYTGLTLDTSGGATYLYAADATGHIEVFNTSFNNVTSTTFAGKFVDPNPVAGFTPYNIQNLNGNLFVTYAAATKTGAPLPGGYVDEFDAAGNFIARIATNGPLNAPWGLTIAPAGFGTLGGDLLVGNLYNSQIDAFNLSNADHLDDTITVSTGFSSPVGLWALDFHPGGPGVSNPDALYFTSGINNQADGLFGYIEPVPEPSTWMLGILGMSCLFGIGLRKRSTFRH